MSNIIKDPGYYRDKILGMVQEEPLEEKNTGLTKDKKFRRTYIGVPESEHMTDSVVTDPSPQDDDVRNGVSARFSGILLDLLHKDPKAGELKKMLPRLMRQHDLTSDNLGSGDQGRKRWQTLVSSAVAYWVELQKLKRDSPDFLTSANAASRNFLKKAIEDAFPEKMEESIDPEDIAAIQSIRDISAARDAALRLAFANARSPERRADLRDQIRQAGTVPQLVKLLWSMKLSNDGLKTGSQTVRTRKGVGYSTR